MVFRPRLFQGNNNLFILCSFLLAAGFILQIKVFFINHQKQMRLEEYNKQINSMSETIEAMEKQVKQSSVIINDLEVIVETYKHKKVKMRMPVLPVQN